MAWKALCFLADTPYPALVVISESMEPAFQRGDILLVVNHDRDVQTGDLPVCWFPERPYPMVHRAIETTYSDGKGDHQEYTC